MTAIFAVASSIACFWSIVYTLPGFICGGVGSSDMNVCEALDALSPQALDDYEAREAYHLEYIAPALAIQKNRSVKDPYYPMMFEREARVLERLIAEGLIKAEQPCGLQSDQPDLPLFNRNGGIGA